MPRQNWVWALVLVLALGDAAVWVVAVRHPLPAAPSSIAWGLLALAFAASDVAQVSIEFRAQAWNLSLQSVPLLVAVVFLSPGEVLAARLVGTVLAQGAWKRQVPVKLLFNVVMNSLGAGVAVAVAGAVTASATAVSGRGAAALVLALAVGSLASDAALFAVLCITSGRFDRATLAEAAVAAPILTFVATTLGLICVMVLWVNPAGAWTLLVLGALAVTLHRLHHRLRARYANLGRIHQFADALADARPADELTAGMLSQVRTLLRAELASLALGTREGVQRSVVDDDGYHPEVLGAPGPLEDMVLRTSEGVLASRSAAGPLRDALERHNLKDAMAVPVKLESGLAGVLLVANRIGDSSTFDDAELELLQTMAGAAGVALQRGQLVDQLRQEVAAKEHQALHDSLTGLANRAMLNQLLSGALEARAVGAEVGVLLMDLDEFKEINDTLGHDVGDIVLTTISHKLVEAVGDEGSVARLGGDEFAIVVPSVPEGGFMALAERACAAVDEPIRVEDLVLQVRASMGVAICPGHGEQGSLLLQRADVAMYAAKAARSGVSLYTPDEDHYSPRRLSMLSDLERSLNEGGLELAYQPKVEVSSGRVWGVEALLRWTHPQYGPVPPDEFIPAAEHSGLIGPLTTWVMHEALRQQSVWNAAGRVLDVSVNISARSLLRADLADELAELIEGFHLQPERLTLEITETAIMADPSRSILLLEMVSAMGIRLSIDDFGTGYSSLGRLARMPVDEVKIDKSLVLNMLREPRDAAIVRSTIDLARHLELDVVAEGIEDRLTWERLRYFGCKLGQGYYLSRPMPGSALLGWVHDWEARRSMPRALQVVGGVENN